MAFFDTVFAWTFNEQYQPLKLSRRHRDEWAAGRMSMRLALRQAKRFVLDDEFVAQVVRKANVQAPKMLNLCHLANLPFDKMWVEYNNEARIDAQFAQGTGEDREGERRGKAGFLLERLDPDNPATYRISHAGEVSMGPEGPAEVTEMPFAPVGYIVDLYGLLSRAAIEAYKGTHEDGASMMLNVHHKLAGMGWGYFHMTKDGLEYTASEELLRRGVVHMEDRFFRVLLNAVFEEHRRSANEKVTQYYARDVIEGRGNLRFIVAMLAMINCVPIQYRHRTPKGYQRVRFKNVPYLDHHEVTIHAGRKKIVNLVDDAIKGAHALHYKRHDVRGFWRLAEYGLGGPACSHEPVERDGAYALCGKCQKLLVWVDHFERGDASLGWVDHSYRVKK